MKRINKSNNYEFQVEEFPKQKKNNVNKYRDNAFEIVNEISDTKKKQNFKEEEDNYDNFFDKLDPNYYMININIYFRIKITYLYNYMINNFVNFYLFFIKIKKIINIK